MSGLAHNRPDAVATVAHKNSCYTDIRSLVLFRSKAFVKRLALKTQFLAQDLLLDWELLSQRELLLTEVL